MRFWIAIVVVPLQTAILKTLTVFVLNVGNILKMGNLGLSVPIPRLHVIPVGMRLVI